MRFQFVLAALAACAFAAMEDRYDASKTGPIEGAWLPTPPFHLKAELYPVAVDGKWGFIDSRGRAAVEPAYDAVRPFVGGAAAVRTGRKWGIVSADGSVLVSPVYDGARVLSGGMLAVRQGELWSFISVRDLASASKNGGRPPAVPAFCKPMGDFQDGFAPVVVEDEAGRHPVFIGRTLAPWSPESLVPLTDFSEGLAAARVKDERRWLPGVVLIDPTGKTLALPTDVVKVRRLSEGLFAAANPDGSWGYMDRSGRWAITPRFSAAQRFSQGLAAVANGPKFGFIDAKGAQAIPPRYAVAQPFTEGLAAVCAASGNRYSCGYIDRAGKAVVPLRYAEAFPFSGGVGLVREGSAYKYIAKDDTDVRSPAFTLKDLGH